jgi:hypothetical protein
VVEIVAVKIVHDHLRAGGAHERIEELVFEEQGHSQARELIAVILSHDPFPRDGIVGFANAGVEQERDVAEDVSREHHEARGLLVFLAGARIRK